jgi:hypothetical protein
MRLSNVGTAAFGRPAKAKPSSDPTFVILSEVQTFRGRLLDEIHFLIRIHPIFNQPRLIHASMDFDPGASLVPGFEIFLILCFARSV